MSAELRRLAAYLALGAFASYHWFLLVSGADAWRWIACIGAGAGGALILLALRSQRRAVALAGTACVFVAVLAEGLIAVGIPGELVLPGGWDELRRELAAGLSGVSEIDTPYAGGNPWTTLGILTAVPLAIAVATTASFWPVGAGRGARATGLATLLALYGTAVTWEAPSAELLRGAVLFGCVAAVLWLPRIALSRLAAGVATMLLALALALPLAARVDASDPLIEYTSWRVFGDEGERVSFNWNHTYGALDWPQEGTEVFVATTEVPLYWKTYVLDEFDGRAWQRGSDDFGQTGAAYYLAGAPAELVRSRPEWVREFQIEMSALRSRLAVTAGSPALIEGLEIGDISGDGTATADQFEIGAGSDYEVTAYVPDPAPRELRRSDGAHPPGAGRYTTLSIPQPLTRAEELIGRPRALAVAVVPPYGVARSAEERRDARDEISFPDESIERVVDRTAYERVLALTRRLTTGAKSDFEAVERIQSFLLSNYSYDQNVPLSDDPLPAFLFRDGAGYCQQFSGAMALMLRMAGIPSRVVSGFAPGVSNDDGTYSVSDTDAHSWVEVLYPGIGWVTVDPTPPQTPAHTNAGALPAGAGPNRLEDIPLGRALANPNSARGGARGDEGGADVAAEDESASPLPLLVVLGIGGAATGVITRRRRRLRSPQGAELQLRELREALAATGNPPAPSLTLAVIQARLSFTAGPEAARYVAALGESRYGRRHRRRPGPAERRAFRWAIARSAGFFGWWKALRAIPFGGPRTRGGGT